MQYETNCTQVTQTEWHLLMKGARKCSYRLLVKRIKIYCRKRTHRYCQRCGTEVEYERHKGMDYPYYCPVCDENMFKFETFRK